MKYFKIIPLYICCFSFIGVQAQTVPKIPADLQSHIEQYRKGQMDYADMPALSEAVGKAKMTALSDSIADDYAKNYLFKLKDQELLTKANIEFIVAHPKLLGSRQRSYVLFTKYTAQTDSLMHDPAQSQRVIDFIVNNEVLTPAVNKGKQSKVEPNWKALANSIDQKFGQRFSADNILAARIAWYKERKEWKQYTKYLTLQMSATPFTKDVMQGPVRFNATAWEVFDYSDNRQELEAALTWATKVVDVYPQGEAMDTKANLLYKLGRTEEAIALETKATVADPYADDIKVNLAKMKKGERTWTVPEGPIK